MKGGGECGACQGVGKGASLACISAISKKHRTKVERVNARLKDEFGAPFVRVRDFRPAPA